MMNRKTLTFQIEAGDAGTRLDRCLSRLIPGESRSFLQRLIRDGLVKADGVALEVPRYPVRGGMSIAVELPEEESPEPAAEPFEFPILYEDDVMLVIDKPAGVVVHPAAGNPTGTVVNALLGRYPQLAEQLAWLRTQQDRLPLCDILQSSTEDGCCWYDMVYDPQAVGLFRYLHSNPVEKSTAILREVLDTLEEKLYRPTARPADMEKIEQYIDKKVDANLQKLRDARSLRELMAADTIWVNGVEYKNLHQLAWLFDRERLKTLFAADPVGTIHGDLTIENIICRLNSGANGGWYLIDPNTGNLHESPFLDYGKLLQSLHGSYEFMMKTPRVAVQDNRIDFQLTRSAAYDALLAAVMEDLSARYPREQVESILMHEVIHWLRLMPYKLNKDRKRAPMFYAGLVMVANDVADFCEGKEGKLC